MSSPEELFEELTDGVDPRVKTSFEHIRAACDDILKAGGALNYSKVGKWCEEKYAIRDGRGVVIKSGQPTVKTIQQNRFHYKAYIDARKLRCNPRNKRSTLSSNKDHANYPAPDLDHATKLHINNLRSEVKRLRRELGIFESRFAAIQKGRPIDLAKILTYAGANSEGAPIGELVTMGSQERLIPEEALQALHFFLFDLDKTGIVRRMPVDTSQPQSTWANAVTGKPILSVVEYLALRDFWESLQ